MSTPEEKDANRARFAKARDSVHQALRTDENPGMSGARVTDESLIDISHQRWLAYNKLLDTKKDMLKAMERIEKTFADARPYLNGDPGYFNESGLMQSTGLRLEQLCAVFPLQVESAIEAEYDYLRATE